MVQRDRILFKKSFNKEIQILFPARLIKEKGIIELINACNELWKENYHFILNIVGDIDSQNKSSLKKNNLKKEFIVCQNSKSHLSQRDTVMIQFC